MRRRKVIAPDTGAHVISSVVVFHQDDSDVFFFDTFLLAFLELRLAVRGDSPLAPNLRGWGLCFLKPSLDSLPLKHGAFSVGHQFDVIVGHSEVESPQARIAPLVRRRLNNAVDCGLVVPSREEVQ